MVSRVIRTNNKPNKSPTRQGHVMFISAKAFIASAALFVISHTAIATTVVGSTPAEFNVSGGQASYSIPIQVAPGRGAL